MGGIMVRLLKSQAAQPRNQKARYPAPRSIRHRPRDTRAARAVLELQDGNAEGDWQLWEDSMIAFESQFQSMKEQFTCVDAFASIYQER
jgi:hypothetical protein